MRDVIFTGRDREAGQTLAAAHSGAHFVPGDVASKADCRRVVEAALDFGKGRLSLSQSYAPQRIPAALAAQLMMTEVNFAIILSGIIDREMVRSYVR